MGISMGKYISVDVVKSKRYITVGDDTVGERDYITFNEIDSLPSIDITFCEECERSSSDGTYGCMVEHFNDAGDAYHRMWAGDFCSRGKRRES